MAEAADGRLVEIATEGAGLKQEIQDGIDEVKALSEKVRAVARTTRLKRIELETLNAEGLYLSLVEGKSWDEVETPEVGLDELSEAWRDVRAEFLPVTAEGDWLEKIRAHEAVHTDSPVLSPKERKELENRLKDNVCPICVCYALDGSCTVQSFETCPIEFYLNRLVSMIEEMGHRPWMEDYFERMYRDICPTCSGRVDKNYCPPREDGECSLFTYLPTVVRTIENFMKERSEGKLRL